MTILHTMVLKVCDGALVLMVYLILLDYIRLDPEFNKSYDAPRGTGNPMEIDREKTKHAYERALNRKFKENPFKTPIGTTGQIAKGKISKAKNWIVNKMAKWYSNTRANNRG